VLVKIIKQCKQSSGLVKQHLSTFTYTKNGRAVESIVAEVCNGKLSEVVLPSQQFFSFM